MNVYEFVVIYMLTCVLCTKQNSFDINFKSTVNLPPFDAGSRLFDSRSLHSDAQLTNRGKPHTLESHYKYIKNTNVIDTFVCL